MSVLHAHIPLSEKQRLQILAHLEDLLESQAFAGSRRRQAFLRYVVEETLAGRGPAIKETNIAVDVFGRSSDFDAQTASIVRVTAAEVRKRLAQAYEGGLGRDLRIELPLGGYQPAFQFVPPDEMPAASLLHPATETAAKRTRRAWWWVAGVAACFVAAGSSLLAPRLFRQESSIDLLWKPFLDQNNPVLVSLVTPTLLNLRHKENWLPLQPGAKIPTEDLVVVESSYVGTGGALGAARFAEQLALRHQPFFLKFSGDVAFSDLKSSPAILLGNSRWTEELSQNLRFRIERGDGWKAIVDSQVAGRMWSTPRARPAAEVQEGYSLVTLLMHSESGHPILLVVGLDPRDTQAAVEFLSNDRQLDPFMKSMPRDWPAKSFQVVLHNTIHGNSAGSLSVVASHVW